jgi:oxygen-independent coproporphyrinogen-3 oxidase
MEVNMSNRVKNNLDENWNFLEDNGSMLSFQPYSLMQDMPVGGHSYLRTLSIYIHIPFCNHKCTYCSINTCLRYSDDEFDQYINAIVAEINAYRNILLGSTIKSIHFGGGTPSLMTERHIKMVFDTLYANIRELEKVDIVFEAHPLSLTASKLELLTSHGNISLNLGVQSFDSEILQAMNRGYDFSNIHTFLDNATKMSFKGLGIDLICNLPHSNKDTTFNDIETANKLGIKHLALYPLRVEPNCALFDRYDHFKSGFLDKDVQIDILTGAIGNLIGLGYDHYSIYHFEDGFHDNYLYARDQMLGGEWIGIGAGAYGFYNSYMLFNEDDIPTYIRKNLNKQLCIGKYKYLETIERIRRELSYSFRSKHLTKEYYRKKYGNVLFSRFEMICKKLMDLGYVMDRSDHFELTVNGILNLVFVEKYIDESIL